MNAEGPMWPSDFPIELREYGSHGEKEQSLGTLFLLFFFVGFLVNNCWELFLLGFLKGFWFEGFVVRSVLKVALLKVSKCFCGLFEQSIGMFFK